jgi:hypothetical protein
MCVIGAWTNLDHAEAVIKEVGAGEFALDRDFSQTHPDGRMVTAFEASYDRVAPTMTDDDWQAVREHMAVVYFLSPPMTKETAIEVSGQTLLVTAALLRDGGAAAKGDSAGIAHGKNRWLQLADRYANAPKEHARYASLFKAFVRRPIQAKKVYYSCGMHLLGERDVEIDVTLDANAALEWLDLLCLYLVADRPTREVKEGDGFRLRDDGPRRIMTFWDCERFPEDDFMHNPFGYIRLEEPD